MEEQDNLESNHLEEMVSEDFQLHNLYKINNGHFNPFDTGPEAPVILVDYVNEEFPFRSG
jgi:hypothetical protein